MPESNITPMPQSAIDYLTNMIGDLAKIDPHAVKLFSDFGPEYFNPVIGATRTETFDRLEQGLHFVHDLLDGEYEFGESRGGLALFVQTLWGAAQYERDRLGRETID